MGNWHERKTKTPAYVPENPRAWARRHAEGADAPTTSWTLQKSKITGYTAPSNKYFATRQRLAYHPQATSFTGYGISLGHGAAQTQTKAAPPPPPPPAKSETLPKESHSSGGGSSKKQSLEAYEQQYLARLEQQERESREFQQAAAELAAKKRGESGSTSSGGSARGSLPKGF
jgi:type IV secretory pathway VirB10-like protein